MNLFGVEIRLMKNGYVKRQDCHKAMEELQEKIIEVINRRIDDMIHTVDSRFNDFKDFLNK